jgi:predicted dehydrogenase
MTVAMDRHSNSGQIRWGILGTGYAAARFVEGLRFVPGAEVLAVASRSENRAREFAQQFGVPRAYSAGEDLVRDKDVDVVYVATPNSLHHAHTMLCLGEQKGVLCEKPFALNAAEAQEMADAARSGGLFCMEAMWTRFLPLMREVRQIVRDGSIGDIRMLSVALGHPIQVQPSSGLFCAELGGGSLLDLGVYGISLAYNLLGEPSAITAGATVGATGVDEQSCVTLTYPGGAMAVITASLRTLGPNHAVIMGAIGRLQIHEPVISPLQYSIRRFKEATLEASARAGLLNRLRSSAAVRRLAQPLKSRLGERSIVHSFNGNGMNYEAAEVVRCLREGKTESEVMPLRDTVEVLRIMDEARQQFGLSYPGESIAAHSIQ